MTQMYKEQEWNEESLLPDPDRSHDSAGEAYKKLWEGIRQSREQKHRRMLESFKGIELKDYEEEVKECYQIRFV